MKLVEILKVMPKSQEIVVSQGFNIRYIGKIIDCLDSALSMATVLNVESNGKNITIKLI